MGEIGDFEETGRTRGMLLPNRGGVPTPGDQPNEPQGNGASVDLLGLLEGRITHLLGRFKEARKTVETLQAQLDASEARAAQAADREEQVRVELHTRVSRLIDQIRSLEREGSGDDES